METDEYFSRVREKTEEAYEVAEEARDQSKDPEQRIDIPVAEDLPEKASSLVVAAKFPELEDTGVAERIRELEGEYGKNDERVSFQIGSEIADGSFHDFDDLERACNAGVRVGVSYMTGGITTAPLEGIADVRIRENEDGSDYLAVYYSGPIRSAGGTASAMSVLLADHVRNTVGLDRFKPSDTIIKRYATEVDDYYNRVTAKQYKPEREETEFISEHVPVEVTGGPTRDIEVSNHKDLDRVDTNQIRGGMCLVYLDGLPLKASKIKKRIKSWGEEFGLEHWKWIEDYIELQEEIHSSGGDEESDGDSDEPDYTPSDKFLDSLTAGRPVFAHPGKKGGFRLRYGSSRTNGLAAAAFHPATMEITEGFIATGTQLKVEYPMKGTVSVPCDSIHGPVVRLEDGSVERIETRDRAKQIVGDVDEILFLGDMLVPYGEFVENGKDLLPSPYIEEWWQKELEEALEETGKKLGKDFSDTTPTPEEAFKISEHLGIPLHPRWTYHWDETTPEKFRYLVEGVRSGDLQGAKPALEDLLVPHTAEDGRIQLPENHRTVLERLLPRQDKLEGLETGEDIKVLVEESSGFELGDQAPHYLGARMGRPEKAEKRTIQGDPQILFPCGKEEGGRMRNLAESYESETVDESIIHNIDPETGDTVHYSWNPETGNPAEPLHICQSCGNQHREETDSCESCGNDRVERYTYTDIPVEDMMDRALDNLDTDLPELLKSVRGMSSKHKHVEPLEKGLLREKYDLYVNKDGTVRYDATDIPMTHFTPEEVSVSPDKLREIGYTHDIDGEPLEHSDQVLEMKPQDIVIPEGNETPASRFMLGVAQFVDDLLEQFYGLEPFYNADSKEDLVGELVIGLAPHTSGGTVGRIIGFTDAKGIYSHPYWHAAKRRNCFHPETKLWYRKSGEWRFESVDKMVDENIGEDPETDDFGNRFQTPEDDLYVPSVSEHGETKIKPVEKLSKHQPAETMLEIHTTTGENITVTEDHRMQVIENDRVTKKRASDLEKGDSVPVPSKLELDGEYQSIDLLEHVLDSDSIPDSRVMVSLEETEIKRILKQRTGSEQYLSAAEDLVSKGRKQISNYVYRENVPVSLLKEVLGREQMLEQVPQDANLSMESDNTSVSRTVEVNAKVSTLLGYYAAEGFTGKRETSKGPIHQTTISAQEEQVREFTKRAFAEELGASPYEENEYKITASGRLLSFLFEEVLDAGKRSHTKRVPQQILSSPDDIVGHFLSGYFSGDGSTSSTSPDIKASTVSEELKTDLKALLQRLGISATTTVTEGIKLKEQFPDFYSDDCEREARPIHRIRITSSDVEKFSDRAGFHLDRKQDALNHSIPQIEPGQSREQTLEDVRHAEVEEISEKHHGDHTYCLTVEENHSAIADNIAVGQCDGDEDAILMLMDGLLNFSRQFLPDVTGARSVTRDTRVFAKRNGEVESPRIDELVDSVMETEGFEERSDGFEVNRDFDDEIQVASFDDQGSVSFEPVSALIRHENDRQVYDVDLSRGEISVTGDHSVFVTEGSEITEKAVRELDKGDCVVVPSNPGLEAEGLGEDTDLFEVLPDDECYVRVPEDEQEQIGNDLKSAVSPELKKKWGSHNVYRYRTGRRDAPLAFYKDAGVVPSCKVKLRADMQPVDRHFEESEELYRLLGYLLSEGALDRGDIYNTDRDLIADAEHCIEKLTGVDPKVKKDERPGRKKCYSVGVPETFMRALQELGLERTHTTDKSVPSFVFGADEHHVEEFIEAYRRGDGTIYEEKGFSKLYTDSGEMAFQLSMLTRKLGYKSSTRQAGDTWEILFSDWTETDPFWPVWDILDECRDALRDTGTNGEQLKQWLSNDRKNNRMKTASKKRVEKLHGIGVSSLSVPVEGDISVERVRSVEEREYEGYVYDLEVPGNQNFLCGPHPVFAHNTMDAPLILSTVLNPDEIDDEAWAMETVSEYPLQFYRETQEYKAPWDLECDVEIGEDIVHSDEPFDHGYTHETSDVEDAPMESAYVSLGEMSEKTSEQLGLGKRTKAVDEDAAAELLLKKHFLPDIRGNLSSFSEQEMRCVDCNEKFRRVPMTSQKIAATGKTTAQCPECGGDVLLTISEGTIRKYMQPSKDIIEEYEVSPYTRQQILNIDKELKALFGKNERQSGLGNFA